MTYLALLRGVNNAGKGVRVAMVDLRALWEKLGFREVRTLLNSGNVIFSVRASGDANGRNAVHGRIEKALAARLGLTCPVIVLTGDEVEAAVRRNPFARVATNPSHLLVLVPRNRSDLKRLKPLLGMRWTPERLALGHRVAYVWCANGVAKSPLWAATDRALERTGTVRNIGTLTRALTLIAGSPVTD